MLVPIMPEDSCSALCPGKKIGVLHLCVAFMLFYKCNTPFTLPIKNYCRYIPSDLLLHILHISDRGQWKALLSV